MGKFYHPFHQIYTFRHRRPIDLIDLEKLRTNDECLVIGHSFSRPKSHSHAISIIILSPASSTVLIALEIEGPSKFEYPFTPREFSFSRDLRYCLGHLYSYSHARPTQPIPLFQFPSSTFRRKGCDKNWSVFLFTQIFIIPTSSDNVSLYSYSRKDLRT